MGSAGEPDPEGASSERRAPTCAHSQSPHRHTRPSACAPRPAPGPAATLPHTESFIFPLEKERRWREDQRIIVGLLGNKKKKHCNVRRKRNMKPCPSPDILLHCLFFSTFPSPKPRLKASGLGFFFFLISWKRIRHLWMDLSSDFCQKRPIKRNSLRFVFGNPNRKREMSYLVP